MSSKPNHKFSTMTPVESIQNASSKLPLLMQPAALSARHQKIGAGSSHRGDVQEKFSCFYVKVLNGIQTGDNKIICIYRI